MSDTTDIEKKSLEAHVELCAERYRFLEEKIGRLEMSVSHINGVIGDVHGIVRRMESKRNDQLIGWGLGIIGVLIAIIGWFLSKYLAA